jgi:hypothetical protein
MPRAAVTADLTLDTIVRAMPGQMSCRIHEEVVILNLREGTYYGLNAVAAHVWQLLEQPRSLRELRDTILAHYDVEEVSCMNNLLSLIADFEARSLVAVERNCA